MCSLAAAAFIVRPVRDSHIVTIHRRPPELGSVVQSVNASGDALCVDFFRRADDSFGYEEYRRDVESAEGWFPIGFHSQRIFGTLQLARKDALFRVAWLQDEL